MIREAKGDDLPSGLRGYYQLPDATMTLREGLAEYYLVNPGLSIPANLEDQKSAVYFHNHDSTHVVFGMHTGSLHEGVNDLWTIFGVDIRFRDYVMGFFATDQSEKISKEIADEFGGAKGLALIWNTLRLLPELWRRTRAMNKKWPWTPSDRLLDAPLDELRAEYGIRVFQPEVALNLESPPVEPSASVAHE